MRGSTPTERRRLSPHNPNSPLHEQHPQDGGLSRGTSDDGHLKAKRRNLFPRHRHVMGHKLWGRLIILGILGCLALTIFWTFSSNSPHSYFQNLNTMTRQHKQEELQHLPPSSSSLGKNKLLATNEEVTCIGWVATEQCSYRQAFFWSRRLWPTNTDTKNTVSLSCDDFVPLNEKGYCLLQTASGKSLQAFHRSCDTFVLGPHSPKPIFRCSDAVSFLNYQYLAHHFEPEQPILVSPSSSTTKTGQPQSQSQPQQPTRGIAIQIFPTSMAAVFAIIKLLRQTHRCQLPIEVWYLEGEVTEDHVMLKHLSQAFDGISFRTIPAYSIAGSSKYMTKPYLIAYSQFDQVLFLDSDNFPYKDPSFLFDSPEFQRTTAIFWKDYWNPKRGDYTITRTSLLWELLGLQETPAAKEEFEMESGQLLINRQQAVPALKVLLFLGKTFSTWMEPLALIWGDKDLFRLAWHMTELPFHYISKPPTIVGKKVLLQQFLSFNQHVCGNSMIQHDPQGNFLFFHRNQVKLEGWHDLYKSWKKGSKFVGDNADDQYQIWGSISVFRICICWHPKKHVAQHFKEIDFRGSNVELFEETILEYAREGFEIVGWAL